MAGIPDQVPAVLGADGYGPPLAESDPRALLLGYLDWYRDALLRKVAGLSEEQLRTRVGPLRWSPLGMVKHLGWVERRWLQWGFAARDVVPWYPGDDSAEMNVTTSESAVSVIGDYTIEVERSREILAAADLTELAAPGGRFRTAAEVPTLGRILFHLLQEYARHLGHLDIARELIDGATGE